MAQVTPDLRRFLDLAGPQVADGVAARLVGMADAVFPARHPDAPPVSLRILGGASVSARGAEVRAPAACLPGASQGLQGCQEKRRGKTQQR